jgi:chemotaxis signal transduction protein
MTARPGEMQTALAALRREFDASFAETAFTRGAALIDLLDIRVGGVPYALRTSEIAGIHADRRLTPVPSRLAELIGLFSLRGAVIPVYDLAATLGHPVHARPRWIAVVSGMTAGLAFAEFAGHARVEATAIVPREGAPLATRYAASVVDLGERLRPIVSVPSLLSAISSRAAATKEP